MKSLDQLIQFHKGGGGGAAAAQPIQNTVVSTPPPPTNQSVEVQMAQRDAAKRAAKKKGLNQTILAGETGGYQLPQKAPTVLGGTSAGTDKKATVLGGT